ncbi:unnamed protein product [Peronospora farinosa]|uniref:FYVE-type domain-containing protein n=1 Tax=Peronospora farinosa TaxID=134698 RepID=A0ABN8BVK5_9STRA|nr:unnamed protein product [Peronospora farinosa]
MSTGNQYWMPDHLCKVCYDCSAAFSLFRRRHHCRLCGQIFCHECSNHFIDGTPHRFPGIVRVCKFCFQFADAAGGKKKIDENEQRLYSSEIGSAKPSPLILGPSADPIEEPMLSLSPIDSNISDVTDLDQLTDVACLTTEPIDLCEESDNVDTRRNFRPQVRTRIRHSSAELLGAIENGRLDTEVLAFHNWVKNVSADNEVSTVSKKTAREINTRNGNNLYTQRDIALDKHMQRAHKQIRDGIQHFASSVANSLPESEFIGLDYLVKTLEDIAFVVTGHLLFSMNFRTISGFNYAHLVKVKSIAVGATVQTNKKEPSYSFKWLAGTVCRKHLSHKQMARQVENPRILLFACGISTDRSNGIGRMSSLDSLMEQEKKLHGHFGRKDIGIRARCDFCGKNCVKACSRAVM